MTTDAATRTPGVAGLPPGVTTSGIAGLLRRLAVAPGGPTVAIRVPFTGGPLVTLPQAGESDVAAAYAAARTAQPGWAATPPERRAGVLLRFHDLLLDRQSEVLDLIQVETGKSRADAYLEVADVALTARYYARRAPALLREARRAGLLPVLTDVRERRVPKGVVAVISPWNYPLVLGAGDTLAALAAGNAVVAKPDNQTTLTACWAADLLAQAGLPDGLWHLVPGAVAEVGPALLAQADYVMFTGSTAAGRRIAAVAAGRGIGMSAELGGKNAAVVCADADVDRAVAGVVRGCFSSAGQLCISTERLYVADGIREEFLPRFLDRVSRLRLGGGYDYSAEMGSMTTSANLDALRAHLADALGKGATVLAGGRARPDLGPLFHEPTVLGGVTPAMDCYAAETFGPLVSVYGFADLDAAVAAANDTDYGLAASVWSRDAARGRAVAARLRAGVVCVNESFVPGWGSKDAPMGGTGASGPGSRHGGDGLTKYTDARTVARQRLAGIAPVGRMSEETFARGMTLGLRLLRHTGRR